MYILTKFQGIFEKIQQIIFSQIKIIHGGYYI